MECCIDSTGDPETFKPLADQKTKIKEKINYKKNMNNQENIDININHELKPQKTL